MLNTPSILCSISKGIAIIIVLLFKYIHLHMYEIIDIFIFFKLTKQQIPKAGLTRKVLIRLFFVLATSFSMVCSYGFCPRCKSCFDMHFDSNVK